MSSESMKKEGAPDAGTLHFARFEGQGEFGGLERRMITTLEGKESGLNL